MDLEINSSRVQSDVEERVRENRRKLETEIKAVLGETSAIADRALARARAVQASGATAVEAALAHLNSVEVEVRRSFDSAVRFQELWQLSGYSWSHLRRPRDLPINCTSGLTSQHHPRCELAKSRAFRLAAQVYIRPLREARTLLPALS